MEAWEGGLAMPEWCPLGVDPPYSGVEPGNEARVDPPCSVVHTARW